MSISIRKLNKVYPNGNHALKDVCLEIPTGMFGLLGPNGAGKSTLMRILVALMEPTSGEVNICGYDLMRQRKEIRGVLGYLPQEDVYKRQVCIRYGNAVRLDTGFRFFVNIRCRKGTSDQYIVSINVILFRFFAGRDGCFPFQ